MSVLSSVFPNFDLERCSGAAYSGEKAIMEELLLPAFNLLRPQSEILTFLCLKSMFEVSVAVDYSFAVCVLQTLSEIKNY